MSNQMYPCLNYANVLRSLEVSNKLNVGINTFIRSYFVSSPLYFHK